MRKRNLFNSKAIVVALVILGAYLGSVAASVPPAYAASMVSFYSTPTTATIVVNGVVATYGWTGAFTLGERVHIIANAPAGPWEFSHWIVNGASVDSLRSQDTYVIISDSQGSVTAIFTAFHPEDHLTRQQPSPPSEDSREDIGPD
jgi:hypothetical protein